MKAEHSQYIGSLVPPLLKREGSEKVDTYVAEQEIGEWDVNGEVERMGSTNVGDEVEIETVDIDE